MDLIWENQSQKGKHLYSANTWLNESCQNGISATRARRASANHPHFHKLWVPKSFNDASKVIRLRKTAKPAYESKDPPIAHWEVHGMTDFWQIWRIYG